jgi:hypothetical protein
LPVNGWFCCLDRKGEFLWHGMDRYNNQFVIVEQFKSLPILLFASRCVEQQKDGGAHRKSRAFSISKTSGDGSAIWSFERDGDARPTYFSFNIDLKAGTINLIGQDQSLFIHQHYLDTKGDAKKGVGGPGTKDAGQPGAKVEPETRVPKKVDPPPAIRLDPPPAMKNGVVPVPPPPVIQPPATKKAGLVDAKSNATSSTSSYFGLLPGPNPIYLGDRAVRRTPPALENAKM